MSKVRISRFTVFCVIIGLLATLFLAGCNSPNKTTTSTATIFSSEPPITTDFNLSRPPKLGETAELTLKITRVQRQDGLAHSKAWIDFYWTNIHGSYAEACTEVKIPLEEVLVSGETSWEGNFNESRLDLHSKIQLPREGIWSIQYNFAGEGWSQNQYWDGIIWVAVADGTAAIMNEEYFDTGPLGYLNLHTFPGGGAGYYRIPIDNNPFSVGLDISKAPNAGEEVTLTCRVLSVIDMTDFRLQWLFFKRTGGNVEEIPSTDLLSNADLSWKTDVKKGEPVVFSTTITFPTEGEWEVITNGTYEENYNGGVSQDYFYITITPTRSYFGWAELPHEPDSRYTFTTPAQTDTP
jgi:hypothetical protein